MKEKPITGILLDCKQIERNLLVSEWKLINLQKEIKKLLEGNIRGDSR